MKNFESRLDKLEGKYSNEKIMMIEIKEGQTLKDAVNEFNGIHNTKLKERVVKNWDELSDFMGKVKISPNFNIDIFMESLMKKDTSLILKNFNF